MKEIKQFAERRKNNRYRVEEGIFAALRPSCTQLGKILDISLGGLSFRYIDNGNRADDFIDSRELSILLNREGTYLDSVPIRTVSDQEITDDYFLIPMRQLGVEFGILNEGQIIQLEHFMMRYSDPEILDRRMKDERREISGRRKEAGRIYSSMDPRPDTDRRVGIDRRIIINT